MSFAETFCTLRTVVAPRRRRVDTACSGPPQAKKNLGFSYTKSYIQHVYRPHHYIQVYSGPSGTLEYGYLYDRVLYNPAWRALAREAKNWLFRALS